MNMHLEVDRSQRPTQPSTLENFDCVLPGTRRRIARVLRHATKRIARTWLARHQKYPIMAGLISAYFAGNWRQYDRRFLRALIETLARGFRGGETKYFYVYRAERVRFFSPETLRAGGQQELDSMLEEDLAELMSITSSSLGSSEQEILRNMLSSLHDPLLEPRTGRALKVALIGDCALSEAQMFFAPMIDGLDVRLEVNHFYFSAGNARELDIGQVIQALQKSKFDLVVMSFLTFEGLPLYTSLLQEASQHPEATIIRSKCDALLGIIHRYIAGVRAHTDVPILLHGCSGLPLRAMRRFIPFVRPMSKGQELVATRLDQGLRQMAEGFDNVIFVDESTLISQRGYRAANQRLLPRRLWNKPLFHPSEYGSLIAPFYTDVARAYLLLSGVKVILVDFDNTLWEGVMADGPVVHDLEGQKLLLQLKEAGVLLVSVSKNDPKNIRWEEMLLKENDFVLHRISWDAKAKSVLEVAHQLDLDPKSFVLLDDNPVERDLVSSSISGVSTLDPLKSDTWRYLRWMLRFPSTRQTEEALRRTEMYREAAARRESQGAQLDYPSMMRSLGLVAGWRQARISDLDRLSELVSRTNQFNTTTIRYSGADLAGLLSSQHHKMFVATLADKFGSLGVVGAVICAVTAETIVYLNIVMSCRAMGFGLEALLIRGPLDDLPGRKEARGTYLPTLRNNPCAQLFGESGFTQISNTDWVLDLAGKLPPVPDWLVIKR